MNLPTNFSPPQIDPQQVAGQVLISPTGQTVILAIIAFIFLILIGFSRRYLAKSSLQGVWAGIVIGIMLIVGIEYGFVWAAKEFTGGEKAQFVPENIKVALGMGQKQITQVLGTDTERQVPTASTVVQDFEDLNKLDSKFVSDYICKPSTPSGTIQ